MRFADRKIRKSKLRSTFGKTTKSPFLWAVVHSDRNEFATRLQELHNSFWSGDKKPPSNLALGDCPNGEEYQTALLRITRLAYGLVPIDSNSEDSNSEQIEAKGFEIVRDPLLQQLLNIELPL